MHTHRKEEAKKGSLDILSLMEASPNPSGADENLYFRHQKMDEDLKLRPDFEPFTPRYSLNGGCPFKFLGI